MNETNLTTRERHVLLARLANFLDDLPSDKFHMPTWCSADATPNLSCGTAGCACGWAATIYHRHGLVVGPDEHASNGFCVFYKGELGEVAFAVFFGIDVDYANWITTALDVGVNIRNDDGGMTKRLPSYLEDYNIKDGATEKITPRMAADRIRKVLAIVDPEALAVAADSKPEPVAAVR